ncbi:hypothetical protein GOP47_0019319 [Adiantum capillus-veneris]|uniref:Uncharacterized protein n=1 Tax=Adiantum capillus-veneris TaxID=13818 RepID=A0A9D4UF11_ADICA|nr:hypothetical protein GOP47_0019319 [Adiantum capillus-veneris]
MHHKKTSRYNDGINRSGAILGFLLLQKHILAGSPLISTLFPILSVSSTPPCCRCILPFSSPTRCFLWSSLSSRSSQTLTQMALHLLTAPTGHKALSFSRPSHDSTPPSSSPGSLRSLHIAPLFTSRRPFLLMACSCDFSFDPLLTWPVPSATTHYLCKERHLRDLPKPLVTTDQPLPLTGGPPCSPSIVDLAQ